MWYSLFWTFTNILLWDAYHRNVIHLLDTDNYLIPNCSFQLYFRLFLVMGLSHSIAALSFLISSSSTFTEWTEVFLSLQGVWIFLLFVLKRRVFHLIKERCVCAMKTAQHNNRTVATSYIWSVCFVVIESTRNEIEIMKSIFFLPYILFQRFRWSGSESVSTV